MTYKTALAKLNLRPSRKVAHNTTLRPVALDSVGVADSIALRLHSTDILTFHRNGSVTATSGGWKTSTTKDRLNSYLPHGWRVYQDKGVWYWSRRTTTHGSNGEIDVTVSPGSGTPFTDGDRIGPRGALLAQATASAAQDALRLRRQILKFAKLCADRLPLPQPGAGDCLSCQSEQDGHNGSTAHLISHMDEGYAVPSLVLRALREAGESHNVIAAAFVQPTGVNVGFLLPIARARVKSSVASYLQRRFGLPARGGNLGAARQGFALR